ncbi:ORF2 [Solenopsis invicta virus 7]|jgi:hypothetical protein|nr:ORF2 [Solenopsis invicta virus 7]
MQGNMFEQQKYMARLNAELRGYMTPGAAYGGNAAGLNPPGGNTSSLGTQTNTGLTAGRLNAGRAGLGYGEPRAQAKMVTSKGSNIATGPSLQDDIDEGRTKTQPFSRSDPNRQGFRGPKGRAQNVASLLGGDSRDQVVPESAASGAASGLRKNQQIAEAGAMGGPEGMLMEAGRQEAEGQHRMGVGLGAAIGSSFA